MGRWVKGLPRGARGATGIVWGVKKPGGGGGGNPNKYRKKIVKQIVKQIVQKSVFEHGSANMMIYVV